MNKKTLGTVALATAAALALAGCETMSQTQRNTAIGAGVGAVDHVAVLAQALLQVIGGAQFVLDDQ